MIKKGDKIRCRLALYPHLTVNKIYEALEDQIDYSEGTRVKVLDDKQQFYEYFTYRFEKVIDTAEQQNKPDMDDNSALLSSALASLELAQNALKKLQEIPAPTTLPDPIRWKPVDGDGYWLMNELGSVNYNIWADDRIDDYRYKKGNLFKDMEEAGAHNSYLIENADRHYCERLLIAAIAQANKENDNWMPYWGVNHTKHCFRIEMVSNEVWIQEVYCVANFPSGFYFSKESEPRIKSILGPQADRIIKIAITGKE